MGGRQPVLIKAFAAGRLFAVKSRSVPRRRTDLPAARARLGREAGGERQGADQHGARETGHPCPGRPSLKAIFVTLVQQSTSMGTAGITPRFEEAEGCLEPLELRRLKTTRSISALSPCFFTTNADFL